MTVTVWHYTTNLPPELVEEERLAEQQRRKQKTDDDDEEKSKIIDMFDRKVTLLEIVKPSEFLSDAPKSTTGVVMAISGKSAFPIYDGEHGLHAFIRDKTTDRLLVHTSDVEPKNYVALKTLARRGSVSPVNYGEGRRTYNRTEGYVEDHQIAEQREWRTDLAEVLQAFTKRSHQLAAEKLIDE